MDVNNDGCPTDLALIKGESVIGSFWRKDNFEADAFTCIKWRLDEVKIRRLDLKLWKLSPEFSRVRLNSWVVSEHILAWGQWLVGSLKSCSMLINNSMATPNNTFCLGFIANHDSHIVTISKEEAVVRCQLERCFKGRIIEDVSWVAASSRFKSTVLLLRLDNSHLRAPDDNLRRRKGVFTTREMLNGQTLCY